MIQTHLEDSPQATSPTPSKPERVYYVDWMRILAVLLLIPFHTACIFNVWVDFYVKNAETSDGLSFGIIGLLNYWHMPLLFLLAGVATWYSLGARGGGGYVRERIKRLLIPLLFGVLVIVPPQAYAAALLHATFAGSWLEYLPYYFTPHLAETDFTGLIFTVAHLWFILCLFEIVLVALPLLLLLKREAGRRAISAVAGLCERRGVLLLFCLPLIVAGLLPSIGGRNLFYYGVLFVLGFLLVADARFSDAIARESKLALGLAGVSQLVLGALQATGLNAVGFSWTGAMVLVLSSLCTGSWLVALLGLGQRWLNFNHAFLRYANEAAYPFYLLHQTFIVLIGYYVVQWKMPVIAAFLVIAAAALVSTLVVYDVVVKRNNVTRFLFGMKPLPPAPRAVPQSVAGHATG